MRRAMILVGGWLLWGMVMWFWRGPVAAQGCPPLPPATGRVVTVTTEAQLWTAVNENVPNTTILLANGTYNLGQNGHYLWMDTPNVTLRSASGNREAVILDDNYEGTEIITVLASNITIADLTVKRAGTHPIHVVGSDSGDTLNTLIYNVHIIDPRQQGIKINANGAKTHFPDNGVVACSVIELTDVGRPYIQNNCYTGGIDGHQARNWVIRDNRISGFWCASGLSEHAVHFWSASRDTVVERNYLFNNARGVGFGLGTSGSSRNYGDTPCPGTSGFVDHYGGTVRNNFVFANQAGLFASASGMDCGLCFWNACRVAVYHNTVATTQAPAFSSIEWRFANTSVTLTNNLASHTLRERDGATAVQTSNLAGQPLTLFVDGANGNLHLAAGAGAAIDHGTALAAGLCDGDIDGQTRPLGAARDIGADEYGIAVPAAVGDLRITRVVTTVGTMTVTLAWSWPAGAVTGTLRYSSTMIPAAGWAGASALATVVSPTAVVTVSVPYNGGTFFAAMKTQNAGGDSLLSNVPFWPDRKIYLPLVLKP